MFARLALPSAVCLLLTLPFAVSSGQNPVYDPPAKVQRARIAILALGTSVHQGFSGNEEVYLAEVSFRGHEPELAKLVDDYPSSEAPILRSLLVARHPLSMILTPDPECDSTGKTFFSSAKKNIFDASAAQRLQESANEILPCFKVDHRATRLAK
jgi:hypothetical protein